MESTRKQFSQDYLIGEVRSYLEKIEERLPKGRFSISSVDCIMSAMAMFSFKYPSMLQFDEHRKANIRQENIKRLFGCKQVPCDTQMRARLDEIHPEFLRPIFKQTFKILQRGKTLEHFVFHNGTYLVPVDATQYFTSTKIHCKSCCTKEYKDHTCYHHQVLVAAIVHPEQKSVFPFAPEPIIRSDGDNKNDCERNAIKRWIEKFRKDFPYLKVTIVGDGLYANGPLIELLYKNKMSYVVVAQEGDHTYLFDWFNDGEAPEHQTMSHTLKNGTIQTYEWMHDVPLNASTKVKVNVIRFTETKPNKKTQTWVWCTDHKITSENIQKLVKGGRARWKIENETFNTLKNQGYAFEHNFGHGYKHLSVVLMTLMLLAFFIDQILFKVNKLFYAAYLYQSAKYVLWEKMRSAVDLFDIPSFESLYHFLSKPPPHAMFVLPVIA